MKRFPIFIILLDMLLPLFSSAQSKAAYTINQIKTIGQAVEHYVADYGMAPEASDIQELAEALTPRYLTDCPQKDGWGKEIYYSFRNFSTDYSGRNHHYWLGSSAGQTEFGGFLKYILRSGHIGQDIIFSNGEFLSKARYYQTT